MRGSLLLAFCALATASPAQAGTTRLVRTSLDDARAEVAPANAARIIRSTLDDPSHGAFPLDEASVRLIRVTLEEAAELEPLAPSAARHRAVRTTLD